MKIIAKRFRFHKMWEILMIDGQVHFLVKDILPYFGLSPKSQGTIKGAVSEPNRMIITGPMVRNLKHVTGRAMVINQAGLVEFINTLDVEFFKKGQEFIKYVNGHATPELNVKWKKEFGVVHMVDDLPFNDPPQDDPNMFDMIREMEVAELKQKVSDLEKRVASLEKTIKDDRLASLVETKEGKPMIDADALIRFLKGSGPGGNVR